nr:uncharacterized protein LOC113825952 isoform X1 [Penaeus vannamei]
MFKTKRRVRNRSTHHPHHGHGSEMRHQSVLLRMQPQEGGALHRCRFRADRHRFHGLQRLGTCESPPGLAPVDSLRPRDSQPLDGLRVAGGGCQGKLQGNNGMGVGVSRPGGADSHRSHRVSLLRQPRPRVRRRRHRGRPLCPRLQQRRRRRPLLRLTLRSADESTA